MTTVRKVILALALVLTVLVGGIGPMGSVADASHNPTMSCWYLEGTQWDNPNYGPFWQEFQDGWWYYYWWEHWEECEDGWWDFVGWHRHWYKA